MNRKKVTVEDVGRMELFAMVILVRSSVGIVRPVIRASRYRDFLDVGIVNGYGSNDGSPKATVYDKSLARVVGAR